MSEFPAVRECYPLTGDWFLVAENTDHKWYIERLILWALLPSTTTGQQVEGVDSQGHLGSSLERINYFFAYGLDPSPVKNMTWKELHDRTLCGYLNVRDITQLLRDSWKLSEHGQPTS